MEGTAHWEKPTAIAHSRPAGAVVVVVVVVVLAAVLRCT